MRWQRNGSAVVSTIPRVWSYGIHLLSSPSAVIITGTDNVGDSDSPYFLLESTSPYYKADCFRHSPVCTCVRHSHSYLARFIARSTQLITLLWVSAFFKVQAFRYRVVTWMSFRANFPRSIWLKSWGSLRRSRREAASGAHLYSYPSVTTFMTDHLALIMVGIH